MTNFLKPIFAGIVCLCCTCALHGQFLFSYDGPENIYVDSSCTAPLEWGHPETPDVFPTMPGQVIISWMIHSISGGYMIGDSVLAGEVVTVFYQARDNMGHISLFGFNISFLDNTPPEFDPASLPDDVTVICISDVPIADVQFSDNCDPDSIEVTIVDGGVSDVCLGGIVNRTWTITDASGNSATYVQEITVVPDTVAPMITGSLENGSAPCGNAMDAYTAWLEAQRAAFTAEDVGCGVASLTDNAPPVSALLGFCGDLEVAFFAADSCDNSTSVIATFSVTNNEAPEITVQASDGMVSCTSGDPQLELEAWLADMGGAEATDDCSLITWSTDPAEPSFYDVCNAALVVTFIADDGCGNTASTTAEFFVQDTTAPVISMQAQNMVLNCSTSDWMVKLPEWLGNHGNAVATDICTEEDSIHVLFRLNGMLLDSTGVMNAFQDSIMDGTCVDGVVINGFIWNNILAMIDLEFVFVDNCGNTGSTSAVFAVSDALGPEFVTIPQDSILGCVGGDIVGLFTSWYETGGFAVTTDDCGLTYYTGIPGYEEALAVITDGLDSACVGGVTVDVTFQVHDFCGNTNPEAHVATFGVMGSMGPVLVEEPIDLFYDCTGNVLDALVAWLDTLGGAAVQDDCGNIDWMFSWSQGGMTHSGMPGTGPYPGAESLNCDTGLPVTFSATDLCNNTVSGVAGFFFADSIAPEVSFDSVLTIPCDSLETMSISVSDNCTGTPGISFVDQTLSGDTTSCFNGTLIRTWTISDDCGNITTAIQTIHTEDLDPPSFIAPPDTILYCVDGMELMSGEPMSVSDNCDPDPSVTYSDVATGSGCSITIVRTWYVSDACNNVQTAVQSITIIDTLAPMIEVAPMDLILECGSEASLDVAFSAWISSGAGATLIDNCGDVEYFIAVPGSYSLGDTTTWPGTSPVLPEIVCGDDTLGITQAEFVFSDACGNAGVRSLQILIVDTAAPLFTNCPGDTSILLEAGFCEGEVTLSPPLPFDLCGSVKDTSDFMILKPIVSITPGDSTVVVNPLEFVFDVPGPPSRITEPVTISIILRQADIDSTAEYFNVLGDDGNVLGITTTGVAECDSSETTFVIPVELVNQWALNGEIVITLVPNTSPGGDAAINDVCGGSTAEVSMRVISGINDSLPVSYMVDTMPRVLLDPIADVTFTLGAGVHTVTWFTTDCGGNEGSCVTQITMVDQEPPEIICPGDIERTIEDGEFCLVEVSLAFPDVKDSCGIDKESATYRIVGDTIIDDTLFGDVDSALVLLPGGTHTVIYTVSDQSGNTATCSFMVTVRDSVAPMAVCQSGVAFIHPSGLIPLEVDAAILDGGSSDNCRVDTILVIPGIFPCDSAGTEQLVELIVIDQSGNRDTCQALLQLEVQPIEPTYEIGICAVDSLHLFANVPIAPGDPYSFEWSGPHGFTSTDENPSIPGVDSTFSGTYTVIVIGANGCRSMGSVVVDAGAVQGPVIMAEFTTVCEGDTVVLSATEYQQVVTYRWYRGMPPGGLLIGSTSEPMFMDTPPLTGSYSYYVVAENANCATEPSMAIMVSVVDPPTASVQEAFIEVCEGSSITLGTDVSGPNITYAWAGPNGFSSDEQFPTVPDVVTIDGGIYSLVVYEGGCASEPATVDVVVAPRPDQPIIEGDSISCVGGMLTLTVNNISGVDQFIWQNPQMDVISTSINTLELNNISQDVEGGWTVTAMLGDCPSEVSEPFFVSIADMLPIMASNSGPFCEGSGDSITLEVDILPDVIYHWTGPGGFESDEANPFIPGVEGTYTVTAVSANGCTAMSSTIVTADDPPGITGLSNTAGVCADSSQSLTFAITLFPPDNGAYDYLWTGPNGFTSTDSVPVIPGLSSALNGTYTLVVSLGSCRSAPMSTEVNVMNAPAQPVITGPLTYCSGESLLLTAPVYPGDSVLYIWHTPVGDIEIWNNNTLAIDDLMVVHSGSYTVIVHIDDCDSRESEPLVVVVSQVVSTPVVSAPATVCTGDTLQLSTQSINGGVYTWTGPGGYQSQSQNPVIFPAMAQASGAYRVVVQVGDCVSDTSIAVEVDVLPLPTTPVAEMFNGSVCLGAPEPVVLCLSDTTLTTGALYQWSYQGSSLAAPGMASCITITDFALFTGGLNSIEVTAVLDGCQSPGSGFVDVQMYDIPMQSADAGPDMSACLNDQMSLNAQFPGLGVGMWSSPDPGVSFSDANDPFSIVSGLSEGENILIWTLSFETCLAYSEDTTIISIETTPLAVRDSILVQFGETVEFNIATNDIIQDGYVIRLLPGGPMRGNVLYRGQGRVTYDPNLGFVGVDRFTYEICSEICPDQCTTAEVILQVGDENDCFIPSLFTPNGDGTNDRLIIPCLETARFPTNRILIFNEWGDTVFEAQPYMNNWEGTRNGKDLPVATYFYIVDFGDGRPVQTGFLILER